MKTKRECIDCGRKTTAKEGICRNCKRARKEAWEQDVQRFRAAVSSVWRNIREREARE